MANAATLWWVLESWFSQAQAQASEKLLVGGQAVIEGVLMKGPELWGLAVRRPDGEIYEEAWFNGSRAKRYPWKLPLVRGVVNLCEMMGSGFRALGKSAEVALEDSGEELTTRDLCLAILFGVVAVVGLFVALPLWLSEVVTNFFALSEVARNTLEGVARAGVLVGYVVTIGLMKDIRQVFRYHGAEHKTINAFETVAPEKPSDLTPQTIATYSRIHPRCGTSFLLIAILIGTAVFSVIKGNGLLWRIGSRVVLLPLVVGIAYEIIRLASKPGFLGKTLVYPTLCLQYLTTREPDLGQIEVALTSLEIALKERR
ncbi:MAG: DUF1385 domain-containing protein [Synergistaceae bacterium]|jgi:uncharacterized protein YqhQ|nr:DUF1385 domain-containing protein [Synergistaceae bacterium]